MAQPRVNGEGSRTPSSDGRGSELGWPSLAHSLRQPFRASSPLTLSHLDMWDMKSPFRAQSPVWSSKEVMSGAGIFSTHKASSPGSDSETSLRPGPGMRRWQSLSRLGPEGAPRSLSPSPGADLRAALMESGARRAELVQRLREAQERLDSQTELLKARDTQLQHSHTSTQLLELRQKQLADAVSALEQEKETAELCRFEESRRRGELQDKVLQLELDMLKMRSSLEKRACSQPTLHQALAPLGSATYSSPLRKTMPTTQEDFSKQRRRQVERELREARDALRETQERLQSQEEEREQALQDLCSAKENQWTVKSQVEEAKERLSGSMRAQSELQDQLSEARNHLGQASLERDLLSSKVLRMEDSLEDVKIRLSAAMADKDRIMQEKAELHQRVQSLELQLERAQYGREGFTDQVCELHRELVDAKAQVNRQEQEKVHMKEELLSLTESHKAVSTELRETRQRLEAVSGKLQELEGEKVIHTNQIVALETERSQLIGEKEELEMESVAQRSSQEEVTEFRESQNSLLLENQELQSKCQILEAGILVKEAALRQKEAELQQREVDRAQVEADMAEKVEEQRSVGSHWKERWQEVTTALRTTQDQLEEASRQHSAETSQLEAGILVKEAELQQKEAELQQKQAELQQREEDMAEKVEEQRSLGSHWKERWQEVTTALRTTQDQLEEASRQHSAEMSRLRQETAELAQELEKLQREAQSSREQMQTVLQQKAEMEEELNRVKKEEGTLVKVELDAGRQQLDLEKSRSQALLQQLSSPEVDGELGQMRAELQKVWDMLRERDTELEEHQQELQSARGQVSQQSSEVQRLEQQLTDMDEELEKKDQALRSAERLRDAERTETQITISLLEMKLAELMELGVTETDRKQGPECSRCSGPATSQTDSLQAELEEMRNRNAQLQQERDKVVQTLQQLQQRKTERVLPENKKEIRPENLDHDKQRRLVTEQLKSLFKEREQLGRAYHKSAATQRGSQSLQDWTAESKVVKNAVDMLADQKRREQELQKDRNSLPGATQRDVPNEQQGAPDIPELQGMQEQMSKLKDELQKNRNSRPGATQRDVPNEQQGAPDISALQGMQEQMVKLKDELQSKTDRVSMSAMSVEICNLRERNENLLTAKLRVQQQIQGLRGTVPPGERKEQGGPQLSAEGKRKLETSFNPADGTYLAKPVTVVGSEEEDGDKKEEEVKAALVGEAEESSPQDPGPSCDCLPSPVPPTGTSTPRLHADSPNNLSLQAPSPDLSLISPRSWGGSQECLFSPRPYRSRATRSFPPAESLNSASSSPRIELECKRQ
ncbi:trichohyalin-like [Conger conger]|uniref:trichohyalin-like n=1 Tax=Conger conger TaxID=82655 RepID=UPI002A5A2439|nr:trichohyalin-like [Conger conger]